MFSITDHYGDAGETLTRCPFAPIGVLLSKIAEKDVCPAGTADRVGPGDRWWERGTGRPTNHWETKLPLDPANPLLGTSPREPKAGYQRGVRPTRAVALSTEVQRRERRRVHRGTTDTHPRPTHSGRSSGLRKEANSDPRSCTDPPRRLVLSVRREGQTPSEPLPGPEESVRGGRKWRRAGRAASASQGRLSVGKKRKSWRWWRHDHVTKPAHVSCTLQNGAEANVTFCVFYQN